MKRHDRDKQKTIGASGGPIIFRIDLTWQLYTKKCLGLLIFRIDLTGRMYTEEWLGLLIFRIDLTGRMYTKEWLGFKRKTNLKFVWRKRRRGIWSR